jgi:redox-sensitive bicupin YhaK (pirin superfamily)
MLTIYPYENLGHADHGWLDARHHFSFASYHDPKRHNFGVLRVINDDKVAAGTGFHTHPHRDMEIITYVRSGAITHRDSEGNVGRTGAGDVQVMSAGSGVAHSEHNLENEDTTLYQIWIYPNAKDVQPRWDAREFPKTPVKNALNLIVSGDKNDDVLFIHQDAKIYAGRLNAGTEITHKIKHRVYILVSDGQVEIDGKLLKKGDGAEIIAQAEMQIKAISDCEILVIDVP